RVGDSGSSGSGPPALTERGPEHEYVREGRTGRDHDRQVAHVALRDGKRQPEHRPRSNCGPETPVYATTSRWRGAGCTTRSTCTGTSSAIDTRHARSA